MRTLPTSDPDANQPPAPEASMGTCVGSLGITCEIDENLDIVRSGNRTLLRRRLKDLVESYLPQAETPWRYVYYKLKLRFHNNLDFNACDVFL